MGLAGGGVDFVLAFGRDGGAGAPARLPGSSGLPFDAAESVVFEGQAELGVVRRAADVGPFGGWGGFDQGDPAEGDDRHREPGREQVKDPPCGRAGGTDEIGESYSRHEEVGGEGLRVERQPHEDAAQEQFDQTARFAGTDGGGAGKQHQEDQQRVDTVGSRDGDERGEDDQRGASGEGRQDTEAAGQDRVEDGHGGDPHERLRKQEAEWMEAEDPRAERLRPERQRRLVDRHQAAGVERDEQEVVP